jgi:glycosyltransferase involved in cell wall biosynthesis
VKVLRVHCHYQQDGGESGVERAERALLEDAGHEVVVYERHNDEIRELGPGGRLALAARTIWAWDTHRELGELLARERPDVAHFTNTFPLISPSAYDACRRAGVPVVQALHNYRLLCPAATFLRDGRPCEDCAERSLWQGVRHGCYRGSRAATAVAAGLLAVHRARGTWRERVDAYLALTEFARRRFAAGGLPEDRLFVVPNFAPDPGPRPEGGDYALFVGRLAPEKGLATLLRAWSELGARVPLSVVGEGPLGPWLHDEVRRRGLANVRLEGRQPRARVLELLQRARFLVFPSEWYEGFPLVLAEAFACGTPVVASRLGAMAEIVEHGRTGLHVAPGDAGDLAARVLWAWRNEKRLEDMGRAARAEYEARYTPRHCLDRLLEIYERAISTAPGAAAGR